MKVLFWVFEHPIFVSFLFILTAYGFLTLHSLDWFEKNAKTEIIAIIIFLGMVFFLIQGLVRMWQKARGRL